MNIPHIHKHTFILSNKMYVYQNSYLIHTHIYIKMNNIYNIHPKISSPNERAS